MLCYRGTLGLAAGEVLVDTRFDEHIRSSHINSFSGFLEHPSSEVTREVLIAFDPGGRSGGRAEGRR
jgi:hypothetical protein